jgi:hypothetical protein
MSVSWQNGTPFGIHFLPTFQFQNTHVSFRRFGFLSLVKYSHADEIPDYDRNNLSAVQCLQRVLILFRHVANALRETRGLPPADPQHQSDFYQNALSISFALVLPAAANSINPSLTEQISNILRQNMTTDEAESVGIPDISPSVVQSASASSSPQNQTSSSSNARIEDREQGRSLPANETPSRPLRTGMEEVPIPLEQQTMTESVTNNTVARESVISAHATHVMTSIPAQPAKDFAQNLPSVMGLSKSENDPTSYSAEPVCQGCGDVGSVWLPEIMQWEPCCRCNPAYLASLPADAWGTM